MTFSHNGCCRTFSSLSSSPRLLFCLHVKCVLPQAFFASSCQPPLAPVQSKSVPHVCSFTHTQLLLQSGFAQVTGQAVVIFLGLGHLASYSVPQSHDFPAHFIFLYSGTKLHVCMHPVFFALCWWASRLVWTGQQWAQVQEHLWGARSPSSVRPGSVQADPIAF